MKLYFCKIDLFSFSISLDFCSSVSIFHVVAYVSSSLSLRNSTSLHFPLWKHIPFCFHRSLSGYLFHNHGAGLRTYSWFDEYCQKFWSRPPPKAQFIQILYSTASNDVFVKYNAFMFSLFIFLVFSALLDTIDYLLFNFCLLSNSMTLILLVYWVLHHWFDLCLSNLPQSFPTNSFFQLATCFY